MPYAGKLVVLVPLLNARFEGHSSTIRMTYRLPPPDKLVRFQMAEWLLMRGFVPLVTLLATAHANLVHVPLAFHLIWNPVKLYGFVFEVELVASLGYSLQCLMFDRSMGMGMQPAGVCRVILLVCRRLFLPLPEFS